jgi:hypothetical protein
MVNENAGAEARKRWRKVEEEDVAIAAQVDLIGTQGQRISAGLVTLEHPRSLCRARRSIGSAVPGRSK